MGTVITFPKRKENNIFLIPNIFKKLFETYIRKQTELRKKKIEFIYTQAYNFFYDLQEPVQVKELDIPEFYYIERNKKQAKSLAYRYLIDVIRNNNVDARYTVCKKRAERMRAQAI